MKECKKDKCDFFDGVSGCDRPDDFKVCGDISAVDSIESPVIEDVKDGDDD